MQIDGARAPGRTSVPTDPPDPESESDPAPDIQELITSQRAQLKEYQGQVEELRAKRAELENTIRPADRSLEFSASDGRIIIKVVEKSTGKVLIEVPQERIRSGQEVLGQPFNGLDAVLESPSGNLLDEAI